MSIERVNFLDRGKYAFTYRNMAIVLGAWVGLMLSIHLGMVFWTFHKKSELSTLQAQVRVLQSRQEQKMQMLALSSQKKQTGAVINNLTALFKNTPQWSRLLFAMGKAHVPNISIRSMSADSAKSNGEYRVTIEGSGSNSESINSYSQRMNSQKIFSEVLMESKTRDIEDGGYRFIIRAKINFSES